MSLIKQLHAVREAQDRAQNARGELAVPAQALLSRGQRYPLTTVGMAAGAGFVLGQLNVHPLRVPGLGALLSGTAAEVVGQAMRLVADFAQEHSDLS
ncbi:hypothetical protein [Dyella telluris]|uniref:DUF883 domain-containing protein n=1 Tax=Dyella telluris TaxID=2763498 RepID=A0A7G8Q9J0_9GAMM|nr:hypothetical protein [Dyella telluris]QNK03448.1 hypothetical protein H8F01_10215 [Dyella telluris]